MKEKILNDNQISLLKNGDKVFNGKNYYSVFKNDSESKEIQLILLGEKLEVDLGIGTYVGSTSPLKKSYSSIIEDDSWIIENWVFC